MFAYTLERLASNVEQTSDRIALLCHSGVLGEPSKFMWADKTTFLVFKQVVEHLTDATQ